MTIGLAQQIAEVERELALRNNVYPGLVARKKMRQGEADAHVARMQAVLKTLRWLHAQAPGEPRTADMLAALHRIRDGFANQDIGHEAFRVGAKQIVDDVLTGTEAKADGSA